MTSYVAYGSTSADERHRPNVRTTPDRYRRNVGSLRCEGPTETFAPFRAPHEASYFVLTGSEHEGGTRGQSSESRKSNVETRLILPKNGQTRRSAQKVKSTKLVRRRFLHLAAGTAALPATTRLAWAQAYPRRNRHHNRGQVADHARRRGHLALIDRGRAILRAMLPDL